MKYKLLRQLYMMSGYALKGFLIQCVCLSFLLAGTGNAQKSIEEFHLTIQVKDARVKQVFSEIEKKTPFSFAYPHNVVEGNKKISFDFENESLANLLRYVSKKSKLGFKRIGHTIHVNAIADSEKDVVEYVLADVEISGKISDENGDGLPGATILEKGTSNGTTTDLNGNYKLKVPEGAFVVVSFVGYQTQEVAVGSQSVIDVSMQLDAAQLEEIVVVGYGTQKKSDITGSVSSIKSADIAAYPALGAVQSLQGRAAGVQITSNNGEPGASFKVRVRGGTSINASSDPIYVVDGFVGATLPPPEDIASIEVLKDASATAIYGSRGANGVIMVTTKRGEAGATKIGLNVSYSSQEEINRLDLLNASQFEDYMLETNPSFASQGQDTDWQEQIFRSGAIKNYQLGISGGTEDVSYYLSGTYFDQRGILLGSDYDRFSILSNVDVKATDKLKIGANVFARRTSRDGVPTQEGSGGATSTGMIASAFKFEPDQGIVDATGRYTLARINDSHDNPVAIARERTNESVTDRLQMNFYGEYDVLKDLKFRSTVGFSTDNGRTGTYIPTSLQGGANVGGDGTINSNKNTIWLNENFLTYSKAFGGHELTLMGGYSYQSSRSERWGSRSQGFTTDTGLFWNLGGSSTWLAPSSSLSEWELVSYYTRVNYNLFNKYLLTLNGRYDGSSTFSPGNKYGFFPSGAIAWNIKDEAFLQDLEPVNQWKLRVSYGKTGNRAISPYQTLAQFDNVLTIENGAPVNSVRPTSVANNELTWETTTQLDIGTDIGMFNGRVNLTFDYYRMVTSDLLFSVPLPEYSGYTNQLQNIGKVENKGWEFTLGTRNLVGDFKWDMDFNISSNKNKVLELPEGNDILYSSNPGHMVGFGDTQILREGQPVGVIYGYVYEGVYQEGDDFIPGGGFEQVAGGEKFADINGRDADGNLTGIGDGVLNADDRTVIGNPNPDFIWGWNNTLSYGNFDMNIFFQGSQGNDIFSFTLLELELMAGLNNATTKALERWTPTNTATDVPVARTGRARRATSRFVYDGSFVRLKNISVGYNLPKDALQKIGLQKLRVYVSGQNLLTMTNYEGYDPEVNYRSSGSTDGNRNLGLDYASYPNAKSVTFGLNIGF